MKVKIINKSGFELSYQAKKQRIKSHVEKVV